MKIQESYVENVINLNGNEFAWVLMACFLFHKIYKYFVIAGYKYLESLTYYFSSDSTLKSMLS